jgi:hypothetical protein
MKLFYFNPNDYGEEFVVMTDSEEEACNTVYNYLSEQIEKEKEDKELIIFSKYYENLRNSLFAPGQSTRLKEDSKYTIESHEKNDVLFLELC